MAKTQNIDDPNCWQGFGAKGTLIHRWWECKTGTATLEDSVAVSYKTKTYSLHPAITLCYDLDVVILQRFVCWKSVSRVVMFGHSTELLRGGT